MEQDYSMDISTSMANITPCRFEPRCAPEATSSSVCDRPPVEEDVLDNVAHERVGHTRRCLCANCTSSVREVECFCCHELAAAKVKFEDGMRCILEIMFDLLVCIASGK